MRRIQSVRTLIYITGLSLLCVAPGVTNSRPIPPDWVFAAPPLRQDCSMSTAEASLLSGYPYLESSGKCGAWFSESEALQEFTLHTGWPSGEEYQATFTSTTILGISIDGQKIPFSQRGTRTATFTISKDIASRGLHHITVEAQYHARECADIREGAQFLGCGGSLSCKKYRDIQVSESARILLVVAQAHTALPVELGTPLGGGQLLAFGTAAAEQVQLGSAHTGTRQVIDIAAGSHLATLDVTFTVHDNFGWPLAFTNSTDSAQLSWWNGSQLQSVNYPQRISDAFVAPNERLYFIDESNLQLYSALPPTATPVQIGVDSTFLSIEGGANGDVLAVGSENNFVIFQDANEVAHYKFDTRNTLEYSYAAPITLDGERHLLLGHKDCVYKYYNDVPRHKNYCTGYIRRPYGGKYGYPDELAPYSIRLCATGEWALMVTNDTVHTIHLASEPYGDTYLAHMNLHQALTCNKFGEIIYVDISNGEVMAAPFEAQ